MDHNRRIIGQCNKMRGESLPGWLIFFVGLCVGAFAAFLFYLQQLGEETKTSKGAPPRLIEMPKQPGPGSSNSGAEGVKSDQTHFDFYTILPGLEFIIPEREVVEPKPDKTAATPLADVYVLQAGSFKNLSQADRLRAELGLLGVESSIRTVTIKGNETWHRVRIGPLQDRAHLARIRTRLSRNKINTLLLKVSPASARK